MDADQRAEVWAKTNGHCWYCGKLMNPWGDFTVDHMDPRKQGGGDELPNLVPCCKTCNSRKHAKTVEEYREYLAEKSEVMFWYEHGAILVKSVEPEDSEDLDSDESMPANDLRFMVYFCLKMGAAMRDPGLATTLIYLLEDGLDNCQRLDEDGYIIQWPFEVNEVAKFTGQTSTSVLSHIFFLESYGIVEIVSHGTTSRPLYTLYPDHIYNISDVLNKTQQKTTEG